ncbi:MAG: hypothetical protein WB420_16465, partial [Bradyrhizobium sp.]
MNFKAMICTRFITSAIAKIWIAIIAVLLLQLTPSLAQKALIDTTTGEYTAYGLAISLIASAEVSEIHCGLKGQIAAALDKAGRLGTPIDLDDKENYSAVVFMA